MGLYRVNFPTYGMFLKTIKLHCDGGAEVVFAGDLMHDTSFAKWKREEKYIILSFKTSGRRQRFTGVDTLEMSGTRLYQHHMSKDQYNNFKKMADSLKIKDFPKYAHFDKGMKDYQGHMASQYFKLVKRGSCK